MKKLIKHTLGVLMMFSVLSCDNYLDFYPHNAVSRENLGESDMELLYYGLYNCSQYKPGLDGYYLDDIIGGDLRRAGGTAAGITPQITIQDLVTPASGFVNGPWTSYYAWIYQVNCFIVSSKGMEEGTLKDKYLGTALYFRALAYYDLVSRWREVPLLPEPTNDEVAQSSESECWKFIETDLEEAISRLSAFSSTKYLSRPAAQALMARTKLAQGKLQEAAEYADQVISSGNFSLDTYSNIWNADSNSEVIFAYLNNGADENGLVMSSYFRGNPNYVPTDEVQNLYISSDERLEWCVYADGQYKTLNKYNTYGGYDPIVVSRLSEMYLISAEGHGRVDGLARLNDLRAKRGLVKYDSFATDDAFLDAVLEERRVELIGEGFRWFDLVRTGRHGTTLGLDAKYSVLPVPDRQLELNKKLKQNQLWTIEKD